MEQILGLAVTIFFAFIALYCFGITFKKYEDDDEEFLETFSWDIGFFSMLSIALKHYLRWFKRVIPFSIYIIIIKGLSFFTGLVMSLFACLAWLVLVLDTL